MKAKPVSLYYEEGFYQSSNGNKKNQLKFDKAESVWSNGIGFYKLRTFSKYILICISDTGHQYRIDIRRMFGEKGIRLIKKRRRIIENSIPEYVYLSDDGLSLSPESFNSWVNNLNLD